jgi:hypothetical protein
MDQAGQVAARLRAIVEEKPLPASLLSSHSARLGECLWLPTWLPHMLPTCLTCFVDSGSFVASVCQGRTCAGSCWRLGQPIHTCMHACTMGCHKHHAGEGSFAVVELRTLLAVPSGYHAHSDSNPGTPPGVSAQLPSKPPEPRRDGSVHRPGDRGSASGRALAARSKSLHQSSHGMSLHDDDMHGPVAPGAPPASMQVAVKKVRVAGCSLHEDLV